MYTFKYVLNLADPGFSLSELRNYCEISTNDFVLPSHIIFALFAPMDGFQSAKFKNISTEDRFTHWLHYNRSFDAVFGFAQ